MSIGTAFHDRTADLNRKLQWREWSGYFAASAYADSPDIEYSAIREQAALIDATPLYKYEVRGRDAERLVDRVITRDATKLRVGAVYYTPWCDEDGKVIDDGTIQRLAADRFRWTAADPQLRWLTMCAAGLQVEIEDVSEALATIALQGPLSRAVLEAATGANDAVGGGAAAGSSDGTVAATFADLRWFRVRGATIAGVPIDVSRTGYTGDLGYELWIPVDRAIEVWDALVEAGRPYGARPVGMLALDIARLEAGLLLIEVDYTSSHRAMSAGQAYSPYEIGLGRLVALDKASDFVGRRALAAEVRAGGPPRRLVGLEIDWTDIVALYDAQGLPPAVPMTVIRSHVPLYAAGGQQVGRVTSHGWSPLLKRPIALASVAAEHERVGTRLSMEWTVEAIRSQVGATVVELPFLDLPRRRA